MNTKINIPSGTNLNKISLDDLSERIKTDISSEPIIEKKLSLPNANRYYYDFTRFVAKSV